MHHCYSQWRADEQIANENACVRPTFSTDRIHILPFRLSHSHVHVTRTYGSETIVYVYMLLNAAIQNGYNTTNADISLRLTDRSERIILRLNASELKQVGRKFHNRTLQSRSKLNSSLSLGAFPFATPVISSQNMFNSPVDSNELLTE